MERLFRRGNSCRLETTCSLTECVERAVSLATETGFLCADGVILSTETRAQISQKSAGSEVVGKRTVVGFFVANGRTELWIETSLTGAVEGLRLQIGDLVLIGEQIERFLATSAAGGVVNAISEALDLLEKSSGEPVNAKASSLGLSE